MHTGNPVRAELLNASRAAGRATLGIPDDATVVLVFGGSRGARHLNEVMVSLGTEVLALGNTYVVHSAGPAEYDSVSGQVRDRQLDPHRYRVVAYIEDMGNVMAATDLAICRAGATSIAELTALGVGAVLVPYPYATDDHQTKNAAAMVQHGAAVSFADTAIAGPEFRETVLSIASSPERRASMAVAAAKLGRRDAAQRLAAAVLDSVQ